MSAGGGGGGDPFAAMRASMAGGGGGGAGGPTARLDQLTGNILGGANILQAFGVTSLEEGTIKGWFDALGKQGLGALNTDQKAASNPIVKAINALKNSKMDAFGTLTDAGGGPYSPSAGGGSSGHIELS